ncbi:MAG TPA: putative metalloprotease CJM1_0395 family protein, partial [Polyangiales bacterium]|nr:putative metalloprotease CJM1_0395 family protein [Polyangiales bacterium]
RAARVPGMDPTQQRRTDVGSLQPTAAGALSPAVVNHVRGAEPRSGVDNTGAHQTTVGEPKKTSPEEEHADEIRALVKRDAEVRAHEQAHAAAGGAFAGAASYGYQRGPDGRSYAVSGEVPIDVSTIAGDPAATIQKMQQVKRAALAPRDPSNADRAIAATADALIVAARREQMKESSEPNEDVTAGDAFNSYERRSAGAAAYGAANASF